MATLKSWAAKLAAGDLEARAIQAVGPVVADFAVKAMRDGMKAGVSPVVLTSANAAFVAVAASLAAGAAYVAGDVLEVSQTVAAGGGTLAQGVFGEPVLTEGA